jgi:hypothetical protein
MHYALLVSQDEAAVISASERSRRAAGLASVPARLGAIGLPAAGQRLLASCTSATVRCWDGGDVMVSRGPGAASRDRLTAFFVVDCPDEQAAIDAATRIPAAWYGSVEVRPVLG